jgi:predicted naringenin-chalcone synthase
MGCYAALPAIRVASGLLSNPQSDGPARAEIIHTELCTLHFNPLDHRPEQIVVQGLFADGHIRYSVVHDEGPGSGSRSGFEILAVREEIVPDSIEDMTWVPSPRGFRMTLARTIPDRIASSLQGFLERLFDRAGFRFAESRPQAFFAIHPGGPRIIDSIQSLLDLRPDQVATSRAVLFERGNMSSATLPHIWARMLDPSGIPEGALVASLAFGPGLTMAGGLFRRR